MGTWKPNAHSIAYSNNYSNEGRGDLTSLPSSLPIRRLWTTRGLMYQHPTSLLFRWFVWQSCRRPMVPFVSNSTTLAYVPLNPCFDQTTSSPCSKHRRASTLQDLKDPDDHSPYIFLCLWWRRIPSCGEEWGGDPIRICEPNKGSEWKVSGEFSATFPRCLQNMPITRSALPTKLNGSTAARLDKILEWFN